MCFDCRLSAEREIRQQHAAEIETLQRSLKKAQEQLKQARLRILYLLFNVALYDPSHFVSPADVI